MKIAVVGVGYVGLSNAVLLSQHNEVLAVDVSEERVALVNARKSPMVDKEIEEYLAEKTLNLRASADGKQFYKEADYIVIATPTNYDPETNYFNTSSVESVIEDALAAGTHACIVIKSTIPVGYTVGIRKKYGYKNIIFSPEFLREGKALYDNLYPARIVVGCDLAKNYYLNDDVNNEIQVKWRSHAYLIFANWLNYYVYQETPYNLEDLKER